MVVPNYRVPQQYIVERWRRDLGPNSVMPSQGWGKIETKTFMEYYRQAPGYANGILPWLMDCSLVCSKSAIGQSGRANDHLAFELFLQQPSTVRG